MSKVCQKAKSTNMYSAESIDISTFFIIIKRKQIVQVRHIINSTFYSWIIGFGGRIQIADNDVHKKQFKDFLMENFINKNNAD